MEPLIRDGALSVRRMQDRTEDYALLTRWQNTPHVKRWWDPELPPTTEALIREKYARRTDPSFPTAACFVVLDERPVGYVQYYRWASWGDDARAMDIEFDEHTYGIDIFLGDPDLLGRGIGKGAVALMCKYLFDSLGATRVTLLTAVDNERAQRTYEAAGFRKLRRALDADTRNGQRIESWMMSIERPA
jgi:aminoglycoside 6'-N-acetyltransferase